MKIALQSKLDSHSHTTCLGVHRVKKRKKQRPFFLWSIPWRRQIVAHAQRTQPHHVRPIVYESTHPKFNLECLEVVEAICIGRTEYDEIHLSSKIQVTLIQTRTSPNFWSISDGGMKPFKVFRHLLTFEVPESQYEAGDIPTEILWNPFFVRYCLVPPWPPPLVSIFEAIALFENIGRILEDAEPSKKQEFMDSPAWKGVYKRTKPQQSLQTTWQEQLVQKRVVRFPGRIDSFAILRGLRKQSYELDTIALAVCLRLHSCDKGGKRVEVYPI